MPEQIVPMFGVIHELIRTRLEGLDAEALSWEPAPETNSIFTLVVHLLGSEAETLRAVAGLPVSRVRAEEFQATGAAEELLKALDDADALVDECARRIGPGELE